MTKAKVNMMTHADACRIVASARQERKDEDKTTAKVGETLRPQDSVKIRPKEFDAFTDDGREDLHPARYEPVGTDFEKHTANARRMVAPLRDPVWEKEMGMEDRLAPATHKAFQKKHLFLKLKHFTAENFNVAGRSAAK